MNSSEKNRAAVLQSKNIIAEYDLSLTAADFMSLDWRERRQDLASSRSLNDRRPRYLYKYRGVELNSAALDKLREILVHNRIWMAAPRSLNDPNDMRFEFRLNEDVSERRAWAKRITDQMPNLSPADKIRYRQRLLRSSLTPAIEAGFKEHLLESMSVFCASTDPRHHLMWTHYADQHKGVCIQFATYEDEIFLIAQKIRYTDSFPVVIVPTPKNEFQEHFLYKSIEWDYEKEWRITSPNKSAAVELRPKAISAVIFGERATIQTFNAVKEIIEERKKIGYPAPALFKSKLKKNSFKLEISRVVE